MWLGINRLIVAGPLVVVVGLCLVFGYTFYAHLYEAELEHAKRISRAEAKPIVKFIRRSAKGGNYANLKIEKTKDRVKNKENLMYYKVSGETLTGQPFGAIYDASRNKVYRTAYPPDYRERARRKLAKARDLLADMAAAQGGADNADSVKVRAAREIKARNLQKLASWEQSQKAIARNAYFTPSKDKITNGFRLDHDDWKLYMRFPVKAGSIWIAYDMSGLSTLWWDVCKVVAPIMLVIAAAGILLMLWVARRVNRPLLGISDVIYRLSRGETQIDVPMRERRDTIGTIAQATETFRTEMLNSETLRRQAESANRVLESSISYASFLQNALLPDAATLARLGDHAVVWWPRDIVGGDIYVARATSDGVLAGVIDCTGHGVPGAFMSIAAYAAFDHAIEHVDTASPARVLSVMDGYLRRLLARETVTGIDDGLEMGLLSWDEASGHGLFAGAGIDLYVVDPVAAAAESGGAEALHRVRGSKAGLGYRRRRGTASFTDQAVALGGGRCLYMFSDGLIDQVGGEDCRPFGRKRLEDVLVRSAAAPVGDQRDHVVRTVSAWQGDEPQRDDVTMLALRPAADAVSTFELTESAGEGGPGNVPAAAGHARR